MPQHPKQPNNYQKEREEFRKQFDELGMKPPKGSMPNLERELIIDYWIARLEAQRQEFEEMVKSLETTAELGSSQRTGFYLAKQMILDLLK